MFTANFTRQRARSARISFLIAALISISACATCQQHPVACAVGSAVIVGSIAVALEHHHDQQTHDRQIAPSVGPECRNGVCPP
jgi:hypothetical protein